METDSPLVQPGVRVHLVVPENPRLHQAEGVIKARTAYGALVLTMAAASGEFRAHWTEMVVEGLNGIPSPMTFGVNVPAKLFRDNGCTGDQCDKCGSMNVIWAGACRRCNDCGETSGCT